MRTLTVTNTVTIRATADRVWSILVDEFEDVAAWASGIHNSSSNPNAGPPPAGSPTAGRSCEIPGLGVTDERITVFDPAAKRIGYSVQAKKLPGFVHGLENVWTVRRLDPQRTEVDQHLEAQVDGLLGAVMRPLLARQFNRLLQAVRDDLIAYAETGQVSQDKARELASKRT